MKKFKTLLLFAFSIFIAPVFGQTNFFEMWKKANPVAPEPALSLDEKVKIHQVFLEKATQGNDPEKRLFGLLYLFSDYLNAPDFAEADRYLLEAEALANAAGNPLWQGAVSHQKGILCLYLNDFKSSLAAYGAAAKFCGEAGDSLCLATSLEQMGVMYGKTGDLENANRYYHLALPLIEKYGDENNLSATMNNFGLLLFKQNRPAEAIPYFERAIASNNKNGRLQEEAQNLSNLANAYRLLGRFLEALETYRRAIKINETNNFAQNLIPNYAGMDLTFEAMGDFRSANEFLNKFYALQDSLVGAETQGKITDLEIKYKTQQQELDLQKSQKELLAARQTLERGSVFLIIALVFAGFWVWFSRAKNRRAKLALAQNQENLQYLTRILLEKNTRLAELETQISVPPTDGVSAKSATEPIEFEDNLFNQRILTDSDWSSFKMYFEKANPGFLQRLRTACPGLTDAEERLFLLIKLNLTRQEAASMQGIAPETIKKTRQRLRKRLALEKNELLDAFIRAF